MTSRMPVSPRIPLAHLVAMLIAAPVVIAAVGLSAIEAGRFMRPPSPRYGEQPAGSLAYALRHNGVEQSYAFIRAGADPNAPIVFRDPEITGDREVSISPLLVAVAVKNENAVMMLLSFGARMELPGNRQAVCLARRLGYDDIADIILRDGGPAATADACPEPHASSEPPLLAFVR